MQSNDIKFENFAKIRKIETTYSSTGGEFMPPEPVQDSMFKTIENLPILPLIQYKAPEIKWASIFQSRIFANSNLFSQFQNSIQTIIYQPIFIFKRVIRI
jgi:hypothetical protein